MLGPLDDDTLTVIQHGAEVVLGCSACQAERAVPMEPTGTLLDGVEMFAKEHAVCVG